MKPLLFLKSLSYLVLLNLLIKPIWIFFIDRQVQNIVGFVSYGEYFALFNITFILAFIADAGLSNMMNQRIASTTSIDAAHLLKLKLFLIGVYVIVCLAIGLLTGITNWNIFIYLMIVQSLTSLFIFCRSIITANQYFSPDAFFSVLDKSLMIILCSGFIYGVFNNITLELFLQIQISSTIVALISVLIFIFSKKLIAGGSRFSIPVIIKTIIPFAAIILLMSMHYRLDGFLLERIHNNGAYEAGVYASAYRLLDAGNMVGYLAASFLVPFIARNTLAAIEVRKTLKLVRNSLLVVGVTVALLVLLFSSFIQQLLYHSNVPYISSVIALTVAVLPAYYLVHIYGSILTATYKLKIFISILIVSVLINVILNVFLIPALGAYGCSIAALASQYFCGFFLFLVVSKELKRNKPIVTRHE